MAIKLEELENIPPIPAFINVWSFDGRPPRPSKVRYASREIAEERARDTIKLYGNASPKLCYRLVVYPK